MPKSVGARIPIKGEVLWVFEIKKKTLKKIETQSLKIAVKL